MDVLLTIFWGAVVIIALIVIHELGHFIAARAFGVRVTEFMIGLPGPNIGFEHNGTRFGITCIPLGGYNRITGMEGGDEDPNLERVMTYVYEHGAVTKEEVAEALDLDAADADYALFELDEWGTINKPGRCNKTKKYCAPKTKELALGEPRVLEDPKAFLDSERAQTYRGLPCWKRLVILFAGPLMNLALGVVLMVVAFSCIGFTYYSTTAASVVDGGPAAEAGIVAGDTITSIDGTDVVYLADLVSALSTHEEGEQVKVGYEHDGVAKTATVTLAAGEDGTPIIGITAGTAQYRESVLEVLAGTGETVVETVKAYIKLFNPVTTASAVDQSSSIVGISVMAKQAAQVSAMLFIYLMAVVSISLGIVNLLPVPPLDGGKIIVEIIERITHKSIPVRVINYTTIVFIVLMLILFVVLTRHDILSYVLGGKSIFG